MNEKNVAALASLLKVPAEKVSEAVEKDDGIESLVADFNTNNQVFDLHGFAKLKANLKKETIDNLEESDIPESYRKKSVAWKLGDLESFFKKEYQFADEFSGLTDLVEKIVTKAKTPSNNGDEVANLKKRITEVENEWKEKLIEKEQEFDNSLISSDFGKAIKAIGLDYEDKVLEKQEGLLRAAYNDIYTKKRIDGITASVKGDEVVKDGKLDPLPLNDVLLGVAKDYGFQLKSPDKGGHGGQSSKKKTGLTGVSFNDYLKTKEVLPNTEESDKLYVEWKTANKV